MDKQLTVVVVDQNEEVCQRLASSLDRLGGVQVLARTSNLMLAAELAHQFAPDVIVADFTRGAAERPKILRWLGHMSPASKLVVHSSYYTQGEREAFEFAGASRCLLKGLSIKDLGAELRKLLEPARKPSMSGAVETGGDRT